MRSGAEIADESAYFFDNGVKGNYWSDYTGIDLNELMDISRQVLENGMTIGQAYKAKFGTDFTLKDFAKKIKTLKQKAMQ